MRRLGTVKGGVGPWWKAISRNKQLVAIDLTKPESARILERLARASFAPPLRQPLQ